jgi:glyoxylase-like metal-dependent hydrolase (beta-lactamase superfamily II)
VNRRTLLVSAATVAVGAATATACAPPGPSAAPAPATDVEGGLLGVHVNQGDDLGSFVNAFIVETTSGLVVIDAMATVRDAQALRRRVDELEKPVLALLLTHPHPDHYAGADILLDGVSAPFLAAPEVAEAARRDDSGYANRRQAELGDQWPGRRRFPDPAPGPTLTLDGVDFVNTSVGTAESPQDSYWSVRAARPLHFTGDLASNAMHGFLGNGSTTPWLQVLTRLDADLADDSILYVGHGAVTDTGVLRRQVAYLEQFRNTVREVAQGSPQLSSEQVRAVQDRMIQYLGNARKARLLPAGAAAVAAELAAS